MLQIRGSRNLYVPYAKRVNYPYSHLKSLMYVELVISRSDCLCKQIENRRTNLPDRFCEERHLNIAISEEWRRNRNVDSKNWDHKNKSSHRSLCSLGG